MDSLSETAKKSEGRRVREERVERRERSILHQLEPAAVLREAHLQARAGGVQHGGHQLAPHRVRRQPGGSRPHRHPASQPHVTH